MYSVGDYLLVCNTDSKRRHDGTRLMKLNKVRNAIFSSGSSTFTPYKYMQGRLRVDVRHDKKKKRPYAEINNTQEHMCCTSRSQPPCYHAGDGGSACVLTGRHAPSIELVWLSAQLNKSRCVKGTL